VLRSIVVALGAFDGELVLEGGGFQRRARAREWWTRLWRGGSSNEEPGSGEEELSGGGSDVGTTDPAVGC